MSSYTYTMNGPKCVTTRPIDLENSVLRSPSVFIEDSILYSIRVHFALEVSACIIISILCLWYIQLSLDWQGTEP